MRLITPALTHPWRRFSSLRKHWKPFPFTLTRTIPAPVAATPDSGLDITEDLEVFPLFPKTEAVTLPQILDTFRQLENPQSRVFGGFLQPSISSPDLLPPTPIPIVSGVAEPGSLVQVIFTDEAGLPQQEIQVHSDADGHWVAPLDTKSSILPPRWLHIEITTPTWSGHVEPGRFLVSFPMDELASQAGDETGTRLQGGLVGSVLAATVTKNPPPSGSRW